MSLSSTSNRVIATGDGVTVLFNYNKLLYDTAHMQVYVANVLVSTGYTVNGVPGTSTSVTFSVAPANGASVVLLRVVPLTQLSVYAVGGAFPAATTEKNFDLAIMASQQFDDTTNRTVRQPVADTTNIGTLPALADRSLKYLAFNASGDPIASNGTASLPVVTPFMETVLDDTTAAAARATLGVNVMSDSEFLVVGSADATKKLAFEVDGLTTATTRTITAQDQSGTLALLTDAFTTGDVKLTLKTVADVSWVLMDDKSIGSATSGATGRANADTSALYTLIWTNVIDQWAPVATGRGGSAAADFAANKALTLPKTLGRALAGYGTGTVFANGVDADVDITANDLTVASNNTKWITGMAVVFTLTSGTITGLTTATTYYVIRSSATKVQLATTLANAQNGTAIDYTAKATPVWSITHTYTARVLGETVGEQTHAQNSIELLAHIHDQRASNTAGATASPVTTQGTDLGAGPTGSTGGNAAMNIQPPTLFLNVMVKL